jgi:Holliday junction resolvasome RuvABC endonuclease subunit
LSQPTTILGLDGGLDCVGLSLVEVASSALWPFEMSRIETSTDLSDDERIDIIADALAECLLKHRPDAIAFEKFGFIGDRSKSYAAARGGRAIQVIEGVCRHYIWSERRNAGRVVHFVRLTKQDVNQALGLPRNKRASKADVKAALERRLGITLKGNYDERDALAVAIAAAPRLRVEMAKVRRSA